jgi:hypothetical protein
MLRITSFASSQTFVFQSKRKKRLEPNISFGIDLVYDNKDMNRIIKLKWLKDNCQGSHHSESSQAFVMHFMRKMRLEPNLSFGIDLVYDNKITSFGIQSSICNGIHEKYVT